VTRSFAQILYELEIEFAEADLRRAEREYPNGAWDHLERQAERELCQAIGYASI
jgi:hypothetical protein